MSSDEEALMGGGGVRWGGVHGWGTNLGLRGVNSEYNPQ